MPYLNTIKSLRVARIFLPALLKSKLRISPIWVHFFLTRKCNLNCKYCFVKDNFKKELTTPEVKKVIDKLYLMGIRGIAFFGGEPTIRKDFCEILNYSSKKGIFTYFTTNGTLLNEDYAERIAKTGVDFIELSVDSVFEFNDSKKDFVHSKKVLEILIKMKDKYKFGLKTHLVLTKKNISSVIKTIDLIQKYDLPMTIGYIFRNTYNNKRDDESLYFKDKKSKGDLIKVIDEIIKLKKTKIRIMDPAAYFEGMKDYVNGKTNWECNAGRLFFSVDSDGGVQLCCNVRAYPNNIHTIDKDFFKNNRKTIEKDLNWCTKKCYSNCSFTTSYLINHPIKALMGK